MPLFSIKRIFFFAIITLLMPRAFAQSTFAKDLYYFTSALLQSDFSVKKMNSFYSPFTGSQAFRLPDQSAPWAGNYFPMDQGGIANRWQKDHATMPNVDYKPTQKSLAKWTPSRIRTLSPIEKYDLYMNDYNFSATEHEMRRRGPLRELKPQNWEGFCNGVRCAGFLLPEPVRPLEVTNQKGLKIIFEPADLKALAGASYFYVEKYAQIGAPTNEGHAQSQPNAAVFDMALRYYLAENKKSFVIDSHLGNEVWNESVIGYQRSLSKPRELTIQEKSSYPQAHKKVTVRLVLESLSELEVSASNQITKNQVANGDLHESRIMSYDLFLDENDRIVEGQWKKTRQKSGVDFAWFGGGKGTDADYTHNVGNPHLKFGTIKKLFADSSKHLCQSIF